MERIAMFGGSFNPVHNAHILLTRRVAEELSLDKIIAVPTYFTPLKDNGPMISAEHRLNMCRLAWKEDKTVTVDDIEIRRGGKSYTSDTLREFADRYKNAELFLITGADMFMTMQDWHKPEEIFSLANIVTVPRDEKAYPLLIKQAEKLSELGARCTVLKEPVMQLSSTVIREKLETRQSVKDLIPDSVISYISAHNLYTG